MKSRSHCLMITLCFLLSSQSLATETAVKKDDYGPCGQVSLYCAARRSGLEISWTQVVTLMGDPDKNQQHSFVDIAKAARQLGLHPVAIEVEPRLWNTLPMPIIAHMRYPSRGRKEPHFVTILDMSSPDGIWLIDPPHSAIEVQPDSFKEASTNRYLYLAKNENEARQITKRFNSNHESRALFFVLLANAVIAFGVVGYYLTDSIKLPLRQMIKAFYITACSRVRAMRWQTIISVVCFVAAIMGAVLLGPHGLASAPPKLFVSREVIDLGVVVPGKQSLDILLQNRGGKTLKFSKPSTSCNCTQPEIPDRLQPGTEGLCNVTVLTSPGKGSSEIVLNSNDPSGAKQIRLSWVGMAKPILSPSRIICQTAPLSKDYEKRITLFCTKGATIEMTPKIDLYRSSSDIDVSLIDETTIESQLATEHATTAPDLMLGTNPASFERKQLLVRIKAPDEPGLVSPRCWLEVKYKTFTEKIDIPVSVRFVRDIVPKYDEVIFSDVSFSALKGMKRVVPLETPDKHVDVTISHSPPCVKSSIIQSPSGESAVEFEVSKDISTAYNGKVILKTPEGDVPIGIRLFALK